jgi:type IV secretion system protein TrbJ
MRRSLGALLMMFAMGLQAPQPVRGGAFATEFTQILNHGQLLMQYVRQGLQLQEEIKQTVDMIKNSKILTTQVFGSISSELNSLHSVVQGGMSLAYSLANIDALFRTRFPGYGYNVTGYYQKYRTWSQTSLDTTLGALKAAGLQGQQLNSEQAVLDGSSPGDGSDRRAAGAAIDEAARTHDGGYVEQTELSGGHDSEAGRERIGDRAVL